jgi:hypothetical protein
MHQRARRRTSQEWRLIRVVGPAWAGTGSRIDDVSVPLNADDCRRVVVVLTDRAARRTVARWSAPQISAPARYSGIAMAVLMSGS